MTIPHAYIYLIYTVILAVVMVVVVPREKIHELAVYSVIFGALANIILIVVATHLLDLGGHLNYEPFGVMGVSFFPPIAWTVYYIMFLYFLPEKRPWDYVFTFTATIYSVFFANVLNNLGIFYSNYDLFIVPLIIYGLWHFTVLWVYRNHFQHKSLY